MHQIELCIWWYTFRTYTQIGGQVLKHNFLIYIKFKILFSVGISFDDRQKPCIVIFSHNFLSVLFILYGIIYPITNFVFDFMFHCWYSVWNSNYNHMIWYKHTHLSSRGMFHKIVFNVNSWFSHKMRSYKHTNYIIFEMFLLVISLHYMYLMYLVILLITRGTSIFLYVQTHFLIFMFVSTNS